MTYFTILLRESAALTIKRIHLLFLLVLISFTVSTVHAQDLRGNSDLGRFSVETGVFFPSTENFETTFGTNSAANWRLGLDFGNKTWKVYPWIKFSTFQFSDSVITTTTAVINDSVQVVNEKTAFSLRLHQISFGLAFPIHLKNDNALILRCAVSENRHKINGEYLSDNGFGLFMSAGYQHKLSKRLDFTLDLSHSYNKNRLDTEFRDWSGFSLNMGLGLNIL